MVKFACDDKDIEKALRRLHKQVVANGGLVYDGLTIGCKQGSFIITCDDKIAAGERIMVVPRDCLLPVGKFQLGLKGNSIIIKGHDKDLTQGQVEMMETMMELYNLSGKIKHQKEAATCTLIYKDRELFDLIFKTRNRHQVLYVQKLVEKGRSSFYIDSFLKTRVLGFADEPPDVKTKTQTVTHKNGGKIQVLMPLIDFLNHHPQASGFFTSFKTGTDFGEKGETETINPHRDGVAVLKCCPVKGSGECFVNYGPFDAADTLLNYNYVETQTKFVRSVPMQIKIPGAGTLKIIGVTSRPDFKDLPEKVRDLKSYIPGMKIEAKKKTVTLGFLIIPQEQAPRALRRVLTLAINQGRFVNTEAELKKAVFYAEKQVIAENLRHFTELAAYLELYEPTPATRLIVNNAKVMAHIQLEKIKNYPFFNEVWPKSEKLKKASAKS